MEFQIQTSIVFLEKHIQRHSIYNAELVTVIISMPCMLHPSLYFSMIITFENLKELRLAGNVQPYEFMLPPTWKQTRVANILSGNYCQPKCAEPWVEVKFEDEKQGKVQIVASPLVRLTNKPNATIEDIGSPEKVIASLGPFVTGNTFDSDELLEASIEKSGDQTVNFLTSNLLT